MNMKKRDIVEAIIVNKKNEILMQKKTMNYKTVPGGNWCFFGGEIEPEESPEKAIKRELKEEINLDVKEMRLMKTKGYQISNRFKGKTYIFIIHFTGSTKDILLNEGAGFAFFDYSELNSIKTAGWEKEIIEEYFHNNKIRKISSKLIKNISSNTIIFKN